jgi:transposase-like protein
MNLSELAQQFSTEEQAISFLEKTLWPDGPICPHCGEIGNAFRLRSKPETKKKLRPGLWKCSGCRKPFTVKMGTIFEDSHIPLHKWLLTIHLIVASKKGMSSHQIHRQIGVTYKSAWFMTHRIRWAMRQEGQQEPLQGTVEVDETYVGPKTRGKGVYYGMHSKAPVVSLVQRGGDVRSFQVANVTAKNLKPIVEEHVAEQSRINTDDATVYRYALPKGMPHDVVNHSQHEYSRREDDRLVTTNTVEGFFSLLKRGVYGSFHHISKQHLHRYLSEFDFRYNARDVDDGERRQLAIKSVVGKRLTYYPAKGAETDTLVN